MRKITIHTAQNIAIEFRIASLGSRILAFFIDLAIIFTTISLLSAVLLWINPLLSYALAVVFIFYTLVCELTMNGQTLGKKAMKIRIVSINGGEPQPMEYVIRWAFRIVDIYFSLGSLSVIFISTSLRGQRLGDLLANTMAVSLQSEMDLNLRDILRIEDRSQYQPIYPEAYRFNEEEMLTVKALLERQEKYHNEAHNTLLNTASQKCAEVLGLKQKPENDREFLRTVIKDYIVITRS